MLIQGGPAGVYSLHSLPWGDRGQAQPDFPLATVLVEGREQEPATLPDTLIAPPDLSDAPIARRRVITFQEQTFDPIFAIDGQGFDPDRVDQTVELDTIEEWVLRNDSLEWHPFHIHVNDYQVMSINGQPQSLRYEDTTPIPPQGEIVIRIPFLDFTGKTVYHCHILTHEDFGMMAVVDIVAPAGTAAEGGITVVASGLHSPRGMTWDDAGTLFVAQAGTGDTATSTGPAASLVRIDGGCRSRWPVGLPSSFDPFRDVLGPSDVLILDGQTYVLQCATGLREDMNPATPNGIYAVQDDGTFSLVSDLTTWIVANPTALTPGDYNDLGEPYRMAAGDDGFWVLEANRGELLWVTLDGQVTRIVDLSADHPVWSALTVAPEGGVYAGTLTPAPHTEGTARVVHITPDGQVTRRLDRPDDRHRACRRPGRLALRPGDGHRYWLGWQHATRHRPPGPPDRPRQPRRRGDWSRVPDRSGARPGWRALRRPPVLRRQRSGRGHHPRRPRPPAANGRWITACLPAPAALRRQATSRPARTPHPSRQRARMIMAKPRRSPPQRHPEPEPKRS